MNMIFYPRDFANEFQIVTVKNDAEADQLAEHGFKPISDEDLAAKYEYVQELRDSGGTSSVKRFDSLTDYLGN